MSEYGVGHEAVGHEAVGHDAEGESWFDRGAHPDAADEEAEHEGLTDGEGPADPQEWISGLIEDLLRAEQGIGAGPRDALMARIKLAQAYSELGDMVQAAPLAVENVFQAEQLFPSSEGMLRQLREFRDAACEAAGWTAAMMRREPEGVEEGPSELVARPAVDEGDEVFDTAAAFADEGDLSDDEPTIEMDMGAVAPQEAAGGDAAQAVEAEYAGVADSVGEEAIDGLAQAIEAEHTAVADSVAQEVEAEQAGVADSVGEEVTDGLAQAIEAEQAAVADSVGEEVTDGLAQAAESVAEQTEAERGPVIDGFEPTAGPKQVAEPDAETPRGPFIADSQGVVEAAAIAIPEPSTPDYAEEVAPDSPFPTNDLVAYEEIVRLRYALREAQRTIDRLRYTNRKLREALEYEPE